MSSRRRQEAGATVNTVGYSDFVTTQLSLKLEKSGSFIVTQLRVGKREQAMMSDSSQL
jgi:hypothetical protein